MNNNLIELVKDLASDMAINDLPYDYRVRRITEYTENIVKLLATPAVSVAKRKLCPTCGSDSLITLSGITYCMYDCCDGVEEHN